MSSKDKHYWSQLRGALTAGQWSSNFPAKAPNGSALTWSELFRKFNKHCHGFRDITEVASSLISPSRTSEFRLGEPGEYSNHPLKAKQRQNRGGSPRMGVYT